MVQLNNIKLLYNDWKTSPPLTLTYRGGYKGGGRTFAPPDGFRWGVAPPPRILVPKSGFFGSEINLATLSLKSTGARTPPEILSLIN